MINDWEINWLYGHVYKKEKRKKGNVSMKSIYDNNNNNNNKRIIPTFLGITLNVKPQTSCVFGMEFLNAL